MVDLSCTSQQFPLGFSLVQHTALVATAYFCNSYAKMKTANFIRESMQVGLQSGRLHHHDTVLVSTNNPAVCQTVPQQQFESLHRV
jgi:hypothetical protein